MGKRADGEGSICRRNNGTFEAKLTLKAPDGSVVRKSFYGKTRNAVADLMREYRDQHGTTLQSKSDMTLAAYLTAWLDALVIRPNTYNSANISLSSTSFRTLARDRSSSSHRMTFGFWFAVGKMTLLARPRSERRLLRYQVR